MFRLVELLEGSERLEDRLFRGVLSSKSYEIHSCLP